MIYFNNVTATYSKNSGLKNFSLRVDKGEMVYLVGPSGAGKSTVLKCLYNGVDINEGELLIENSNMSNLSILKTQKLRRKIGIIFQDYRLIENQSVFENVSLPLRIDKISSKLIKQKTTKILKEIGIFKLANNYPKDLSSGEQQLVSICRALVKDPLMVLADEPTGNLDQKASMEIVNILENISNLGTTVIMSTHNKLLIENSKKTIIYLESGIRIRK
jgi:cell division transport system ATP-binding protein